VVVVRFTRPYPDLPYLAAPPALGPIPPGDRADRAMYARHPLATGPYRVGSYRPGHRLVLVRNAQWDPKTDPGRTQYPTEYDVRAGLSSHRIAHALLADRGRARTTLTYDDLPPGPWLDSKSLSRRLVEGATPCTTYLAPDNQVITNPAVRRALVWAYPYRAMLRLKGLTPGVTAVPATNVLPPGIPGRRSIDVRGHRGFATQPRVARRMLARAHALGTRLRFSYARNDPASVRARDVLVRSLRASGFRPDPVPVSADFVPGRTTVDLPVDLRTRTWCGAWPAGSAWLVPLYEPSSGADAEYFASRYVDRRIEAIRRGPLEEQFQWWSGLDRTVLRRWQPIVPLWYDGVAMAHGSAIHGMADDTVTGMPAWPDLWVKQ
jgi:peptide/nickel transport system substrate-binding protein